MRPYAAPFLALLVLAASACASPPPTTGRVESQRVTSTETGAAYTIDVRLPPGYDDAPDRRYPVVFQLDARFLDEFAVTAGYASQLEAAGSIPDVIVVGIGHEAASGEDPRMRDFVPPPLTEPAGEGRADLFYAFLADELVPAIDGQYRTDPTARVLIGHSLGGLFALYAFFRGEDGAAPLFTHVVAADPSYGEARARIFSYEADLAARTRARPGSLYLTVSGDLGAGQRIYLDAMSTRLRARAYAGLRLGAVVLDTDHGGAIALSAQQGLRFALGVVP